jgi:hypothetical protein
MRARRRWVAIEIIVFVVAFATLVVRVPRIEHFLVDPDHGYQLAAGIELLHGNLPGVDSLSNYGPLVAVLTAITLALSGDLVAVALLCAMAWATTVWLAFRIVRLRFGALAGGAAALAAMLCVARFHKWYVWLVPLAALAIAGEASADDQRRRWGLAGIACGVGTLLRPEMGLAALAVLAVLALADSLRTRGLARPRAWNTLGLGFSLPPGLWLVTVLTLRGPSGIARVLRVVPESMVGSITYWSLAPPPFRFDDPLSPDSAHALTLWLLPAVELASVALGGWLAYVRPHPILARRGRTLAALGLMGFAFYPHTLYRADLHHLWQGIWPLLLCVPALCSLTLRLARASPGGGAIRCLPRVAFVLAAFTTIVLAPIVRLPHHDLAPLGRPPLAGLAELRRGLAAAPDHPYAQLVTTIDRLTAPTDKILITSISPQLFFFAKRAPSGFCLAYQRGLFDSPQWRREHMTGLERDPPALVVAPINLESKYAHLAFAVTQPEMHEYVAAHYPYVVERRGDLMLLAPSPYGGSAPAP